MKKLIPDEKNWKDKLSKFFNNKGFYVILAVCIIIVAATAIFVTTQNLNSPDTSMNTGALIPGEANVDEGDDAQAVTGSANVDTAAQTAAPTTPGKTEAAPSTNSDTKKSSSSGTKAAATKIVFERPVDGTIMKDFTRDINTFSESKTLGDFRAHKGIDFKVDKLTKVRAVAAGTISLVENNESGVTIEITHGTNGLVTRYAGLSKQGLEDISYGMKVKANDIIGLVGDPIQSECADGPHLHFEVLKNGKSVDPTTYLKTSTNTAK